jgi:hypothetical protein
LGEAKPSRYTKQTIHLVEVHIIMFLLEIVTADSMIAILKKLLYNKMARFQPTILDMKPEIHIMCNSRLAASE